MNPSTKKKFYYKDKVNGKYGMILTDTEISFVGLVVVSITSGVYAGFNLFGKIVGENLKREEQHKIKNKHLLVEL